MKNISEYIATGYSNPEMIDVDENEKYGYMYYDVNSGVVGVYGMNSYKDLVNDFGEDEDWAKKLEKLKVGESLFHASGAIYCRIW